MFRTSTIVACTLVLSACGLFQPESQPDAQPFPPPEPVEVVSCPEPPPVVACECPEPEKIVLPAPAPKPCTAGKQNLLIIGSVEHVSIDATGVRARARIDTGAKTSSIHAENVVEFERDGKTWVRFNFDAEEEQEPIVLERRVARRVLIKRHGFDSQRRYVVKLGISIGEIEEVIQVTLSDRSDFEFPVLIGRNFLTDNAIVDVSKQFTAD